jgi:hypothetical protein
VEEDDEEQMILFYVVGTMEPIFLFGVVETNHAVAQDWDAWKVPMQI